MNLSTLFGVPIEILQHVSEQSGKVIEQKKAAINQLIEHHQAFVNVINIDIVSSDNLQMYTLDLHHLVSLGSG